MSIPYAPVRAQVESETNGLRHERLDPPPLPARVLRPAPSWPSTADKPLPVPLGAQLALSAAGQPSIMSADCSQRVSNTLSQPRGEVGCVPEI
jgi:hypothetical protein